MKSDLPKVLHRIAGAPMLAHVLQAGSAASPFTLTDECELRDPGGDGAIVRCVKENLASDEVRNHLRAGKEVVKLALDWGGHLSFLLQEDLSLKRLRFSDELIDASVEPDIEDEAARFDAEFAIMALQLRELVGRLEEVFAMAGEA